MILTDSRRLIIVGDKSISKQIKSAMHELQNLRSLDEEIVTPNKNFIFYLKMVVGGR